MPRAHHFPFFDAQYVEFPSPAHPLGMRPGGEGGTAPALGVMINAICDALSELGVRHVEMPATPARVWAAGDCTDGLYHQNNIAAGDAVKALEDIYLFLRKSTSEI